MPEKQTITDIVKRNLWNRGYAVKSLEGLGLGFDLLVENRFKVRVLEVDKKGIVSEDEVIAYVAIHTLAGLESTTIAYVGMVNNSTPTVRPQDIFGLPTSRRNKNHVESNKKVRPQSGTKKARSR